MAMDSISFGLGNTGGIIEDSNSPSIVAAGSIEFFDSDTDAGLFHVPYVIPVGTPLGSVSVNIFNDDSGGTDPNGFIDWSYSVNNALLQYLGLGETRVEQFTIQVVAGNDGETKEITLSITLTGTNDGPTFTGAAQTGSLGEDGALTSAGDLAFTDVDLVDTHTVSATAAISGGVGGYNPSGSALESMFAVSVDNASTGDGAGNVHWAFTGTPSAFQYLKDGESLDIQYTITVADSHGGTSTRTVTLTINGADDNPTITNATVSSGVIEAGAAGAGTPTVTGVASGEGANWGDLDHGEDATLQVVAASGTGGAGTLASGTYTIQGTYGTLTLNEDGTYSYALDNADYNTQALDSGDAVSDVFDYTIASTDGSEAQASSTITINITGSNDAPVLTAFAPSAAVLENTLSPSLQNFSESSTLTVVDFDANDTLTPSASPPVVKLNGSAYTLSAGASALAAALTFTPGTVNSGSGLTNTITWVWDPEAVNLDFLSAGDLLTLTYTVSVGDGTVASNTQAIVITVVGTNDAPVISVGTEDGTSLLGIETDMGVTLSDTLTVTDVDLNDNVQATSTYMGATGDVGSLSSAALNAMLTVTTGDLTAAGQSTGTIAWDFNSGSEAFNFLDQGETLTLNYVISVSDGHGGTAMQPVTVIIQGTNDGPVVTNPGTTPAAIVEGNNAVTLAARSGSILVDDEDAASTLTLTDPNAADAASSTINDLLHQIRAAATFTWIAADGTTVNGNSVGLNGADPIQQPDADTIPTTGGLSIGDRADILNAFQVSAIGGVGGVPLMLNWSFDNTTAAGNITVDTNGSAPLPGSVGQITLDFLAAGEKLVVDFPITVTDEHGATTTAHVLITFTGATDTAQLAAGSNIGTVTEDAATTLTASGTRDFTEEDFSDAAPTFNKSYVSITTSPTVVTASSQYSALSLALQDVASRLDVVRTVTAGTNDGSIAWTFGVADSLAQFLKAGETVVVTYRITPVDGGSGALGTGRNVTITITGTNDGPVAVADTGTVTEAGLTPAGVPDAGVATATGNVLTNDTDVDVGDTKTVDSVAAGSMAAAASGDGVASAVAGTYGSLTLNGDGTYTYTLDNGDADTQALAVGESVTETFTYVMKDGSGATSTTTLTITVNGTNDGPTIGAGDMSGGVLDDAASAQTLTDSGSFTYDDVDTSDTHSVTVVPSGANTAGGVLTATNAVAGTVEWSYSANDSNAVIRGLDDGETVTENFTVTISDGKGGAVDQVITVTVTGDNDAPVVSAALTASATEGGASVTVNGLTGATDVDLETLSVVNAVLPAGVTLAGSDFTFDPTNAAYDDLAVGETRDVVVTFDVSDGDIDTPQTLTFTVTGTNDGPTVGTANLVGTITEDATTPTLSDTGTISFDDLDLTNTHTVSVSGGGTLGGALVATITDTAVGAGDGTVTWDYTVANAAAQYLEAGETVSETFTVIITDSSGAIVTRDVVVTVTGTNDEPVITLGSATAGITESVSGDTTVSASGSFTVADVDVANSLTVTEGTTSVVWSGGTVPSGIASALTAALAFGVSDSDSDSNEATVDWTFNAGALDLNFLGKGETLTVTVPVTITDGTAPVTQNVVITITGTNDAPVISGGGDTASINEVAGLTGTGDSSPNTVTGGFSIADADTNGGVTFTSSFQGFTTNYGPRTTLTGGQQSALAAGLTFSPLVGNDGTVTWTYDVNNAAIDFLIESEVLVVTLLVTVNDDNGGTATTTVAVTINGKNDQVQAGTVNLVGAWTEGQDAAPAISGSIDYTDADFQNHAVVTSKTGGSLLGTGGTFAASNAANPALDDGNGQVVWTYTLAPGAADYLADGEAATETFRVRIIDGAGFNLDQTVTVTITGSNDAPVISSSAATPAAMAEDSALSATGSFAFDDVDLTDAHTTSVTLVTSGAMTGLLPNNAALKAMLATSVATPATGAGAGAINWTFTGNSADFQYLQAGETLTLTYTVAVTDDSGQSNASDSETVTITITGTNDSATITGTATASIAEEAATVSGTLIATDADHDQSGFGASTHTGSYGSLDIDFAGAWTYTLNNASAAVQQLGVGDSLTDTVRVYSVDSTAFQDITITINGTNDAAVIGGVATGSTTEETALTATGTLTITDVDTDEAAFQPQTNVPTPHGSFSLAANGEWTYTLDNGNPDVQALGVGDTLTDTMTVTAVDGTTSSVSVTINGTNDAAVIGGTAMGGVTEDASSLTANGTLTITDVDTGEAVFQAETAKAGTYGSLAITTAGAWTYTLNNSAANVQALAEGQTVTDTISVLSADGASHNVVITITGTNDEPTLTSGNLGGGVNEDTGVSSGNLSSTGTLFFADVDTIDVHGAAAVADGGNTLGGVLTATVSQLDNTVTWTYTLSNAAAQALDDGAPTIETFTVTVSDGQGGSFDQSISISVQGSNDGPVITAATSAGTLTEDSSAYSATDSVAGANWSDADAGDVPTITQGSAGAATQAALTFDGSGSGANAGEATIAGTYGTLFLKADGTYRYVLDNAGPAVQSLDGDQAVSDVFNYTLSDGTATAASTITVGVQGTNDGAVITVTNPSDVSESDAAAVVSFNVADQVVITDADTQDAAAAVDYVAGSGALSVTGPTPATGTLGDLVTFNAATGAISYNRAAFNWLDSDESVTYTVNFDAASGDDGAVAQSFTFTINGQNDGPVAVADTATLAENIGNTLDLITNDTDADKNETLTLTSFTLGTVTGLGTLTAGELADIANDFTQSGNSLVFSPAAGLPFGAEAVYDRLNPGQTATITINYVVTDDGGATSNGTYTLSITGAAENFNGTPIDDNPFNGSNGDDTMYGNGGDDVISGNSGNDTIYGGADDDIINGGSGDDKLYGGDGFDTLIGGSDTDTAYFDGPWAEYTIGNGSTPGTYTLTRGGVTDTIATVEFISFNGLAPVAVATMFNDTPVAAAASFTLDENTASGTVVGSVVASDVDAPLGDTLSYAITSGNDAGMFAINAATGQITLAGSPNFESAPSHSLVVTVTDLHGATATSAVTVTINDLNDNAPVFTSGGSATVAENAATSTVVYTATTTDADGVGGPVTYSLGGTDAAAFSINVATGEVTLNASADYETKTSYSLDVTASDGVNSTTQAVAVSVTDLNDNNPLFSSGGSASVDENVAAGSAVYTAAATDADPTFGAVSYSLSGADAAAFNIDSATGEVTIIASPDRETKASYDFTVTATQGTTSTDQAVTLTINDLNDTAPVFTSGGSATVAENAATSTVVYTATTTDADGVGGPVTYTLGGTDAAAFSINVATGEVTLNASADYETKTSYSINVIADDGVNTKTQAVSVSVNDLNDNNPLFSSLATANVNENVVAGSTVYTAVATDADASANFGPVSYSLSGADAAAFSIDSNTGVVTINDSPDRETKASYDFTVTATQGTTSTDQTVTLTINDLNDNAPVFTSGVLATVAENAATATVIYTATTTDADGVGGPITYTLGGTDAAAFSIDASTGEVTLNASADYEIKTSYSLDVIANDGANSSTQAVAVSVTDLNDNDPVFSSGGSASVDENVAAGSAVYTAAATDADPTFGAVSYSLSGADAAAFNIDSATGEVTIIASPDRETKASYDFTVTATQGTTSTDQTVTLTINDLNDNAPVFTSGGSATVAENALTSTVVYTATTTDADGVGGPVTYTLGGTDAAAFSINVATGEVTLNASADYETKTSYSLDVTASDGVNSATQTVAVSVTDLNDNNPLFSSGGTASVDENVAAGSAVYTAAATDADASFGAVSYSLSGADAAAFSIDSNTGVVTIIDSPDRENRGSYSFTVTATQGATTTEQAVTLTINDLNDSLPLITSASTATVVENAAASTVIYTATANDEDGVGGPVTFSLSGVDAGLFEINAANGNITLISPADFETQQTYDLMLTASDGMNSSTNILTINVTDENDEAPVITAPSTVSVAENTAPAAIVFTASSTDVDTTGETISYSLSGADAASFTINAAGEVSFVASPDFEVKSSYSIDVVASDGANSSSQTVSVLITDVNDVAPVFTSGTIASVTENASVATIVYTAATTDVDTVGGPTTYTLGGADAAAFSINAAGEVTLNASADYESKASYNIDVIASDGVNSTTQSVAVSVIDADDVAVGPVSVSGAQAADEVTSTGVVVATALALDLDTGSSVSYSLTDDAGGRFAINASTGAITVVSGILLDYEQATSHSVSVRATSSDGSFSDTTFSVAVNDVAVETVVGGAAGETVVGGNGNDSFTMNGGNDAVSGGDGNDVVNGGAGTNTLNGGTGTDTVSYAGAAAATTVRLNVGNANNGYGGVDALSGFENIIGSDYADTLIGNAGVNEMWGGLGSDYMIGLDGNDILHGGTGSLNTLQGGRGDDVYYLDVSGDSIVELFAEGIDEVRTALGVHTLATNVEALTYIGTGTFLGVGNAGDNSITGGLLRDDIYGRDGNDTLNGGAGAANTMLGGLGNDTYIVSASGDSVVEVAGQGTDTVQTALGVYVMAVNVEVLTYTGTGSFFGFGNGGDNIMTGGANTDSLYGYAGNDTLNGGGGTDTLLGGVGDDTYVINVAGVSVVEYVGEGTDTVQTSLATYVITSTHVENLTFTGSANALGIGNALGNVITSGAGNDQLNGNNGNDTLISTGGDDRFYGGNGNDTITTGLGQDRVFLSGLETGFDTVTDFASGSDLFFLNRASFGATASTAFVSGTGAMAATTANSTILHDTVTGQVFIDADGNGAGAAVQIAQVNPGQILAGSDFIFY